MNESKTCRKCKITRASDEFYVNRLVCMECMRARAADRYRVSSRAVTCPCCQANLTVIRYQQKNSSEVMILESLVPSIQTIEIRSEST